MQPPSLGEEAHWASSLGAPRPASGSSPAKTNTAMKIRKRNI
jgi:hypothetical protein